MTLSPSRLLLLRVWSRDHQPWHHLGACLKDEILNLLNHNLQFNKLPQVIHSHTNCSRTQITNYSTVSGGIRGGVTTRMLGIMHKPVSCCVYAAVYWTTYWCKCKAGENFFFLSFFRKKMGERCCKRRLQKNRHAKPWLYAPRDICA